MKKRTATPKEIMFIKENGSKLRRQDLAKALKMDTVTLNKMAAENNISLPVRFKKPGIDIEFLHCLDEIEKLVFCRP